MNNKKTKQSEVLKITITAMLLAVCMVSQVFKNGSLLLKKSRRIALWFPTVFAAATTLLMYIGEMILLHGHLYRFGTGFFFDGLPGIVLAPVDIVVILAAGLVTYALMRFVGVRKTEKKESEKVLENKGYHASSSFWSMR